MKKILTSCSFVLVLGLIASSVCATQYYTDFLEPGNPGGWGTSLKTFDEEFTVTPGETFYVDIWMKNAGDKPSPSNGGFWIDFQTSTDLIKITGVQRYGSSYELPGPWAAGGFIAIGGASMSVPEGAAAVTVANLSYAAMDTDGNIIIAKVELHCIKEGTVNGMVVTVPGYATWAPRPWEDDNIPENIFTIHQGHDSGNDTAIASNTASDSGIIKRIFRWIFRRN